MKLDKWHLATFVLGGVLATLASEWLTAKSSERYDLFDRYLVQAVVKDPARNAFAALVSYHHANSSADVQAVWLGEGAAPAPGAIEPLKGWPSLVAVSPISPEHIMFTPDHRLIVTVQGPVEVSGDADHCYFDGSDAALCVEGSGVTIRITN